MVRFVYERNVNFMRQGGSLIGSLSFPTIVIVMADREGSKVAKVLHLARLALRLRCELRGCDNEMQLPENWESTLNGKTYKKYRRSVFFVNLLGH